MTQTEGKRPIREITLPCGCVGKFERQPSGTDVVIQFKPGTSATCPGRMRLPSIGGVREHFGLPKVTA